MPAYFRGKELRFCQELLVVILAEVKLIVRGLMEREDVGCGLEFGDGDEAGLWS